MRDLYWLSDAQLKLIRPYFSPSRGVPRAVDLRAINCIIFVLKRGLQWRDAPAEYGAHNLISLKAGFINIDKVLRATFFY